MNLITQPEQEIHRRAVVDRLELAWRISSELTDSEHSRCTEDASCGKLLKLQGYC
jgi:hypothetical protein